MKTYRPVTFLAIFFCFCLVIVDAGWSAEPKPGAVNVQKAAPAKVGPAKADPPKAVVADKNIAPLVLVLSPGQGETWYGGESRDIQWKTVAIPQSAKIKIEFFQSGGKIIPLADNLPSSGKYSWKITLASFLIKTVTDPPSMGGKTRSFPVDTQGTLKLTASYEGKNAVGESSLTILIPAIKITSPKSGDVWHVGKTYAVTWQNIGPSVPTVDAGIWFGQSYGARPLYSTRVANTGSANITVPAGPAGIQVEDINDFRVSVNGWPDANISFPSDYFYDRVAIKILK